MVTVVTEVGLVGRRTPKTVVDRVVVECGGPWVEVGRGEGRRAPRRFPYQVGRGRKVLRVKTRRLDLDKRPKRSFTKII